MSLERGGPVSLLSRGHALHLWLLLVSLADEVGFVRLSRDALCSLLDPELHASAVSRAIKRLEKAKLVEKVGSRRVLQLRSLDGQNGPYAPIRPEGGGDAFLLLPPELITNGWLRALRPPELIVLLIGIAEEGRAFRLAGKRGPRGEWSLPREVIVRRYNISRAAFAKGRLGLGVKGMLRWHHPAAEGLNAYLYRLDHRRVLRLDASNAPTYRATTKRYARRSLVTGEKVRLVSWQWEEDYA